MREYLHQSSQFDAFPYDAEMYKSMLRQLGAKRIRESRYMGWANQPRVVTWEAGSVDHETRKFGFPGLRRFPAGVPFTSNEKIGKRGWPKYLKLVYWPNKTRNKTRNI